MKQFDLTTEVDPRDAIHQTVQHLVEGGVASLPFENGPAGVMLATAKPPRPDSFVDASLLVGSVEAASDWLPDLSPIQVRLVVRCWPGPVSFRVPMSEWTLAPALPTAIREAVTNERGMSLRVSSSDVVDDVLALLPAPLIVAEEGSWPTDVGVSLTLGNDAASTPATRVNFQGGSYEIEREGAVMASDVDGKAGMEVIFLCTGNTCRSPMAEAIFRDIAARELGIDAARLSDAGLSVRSVGLAASDGQPASGDAVEVAKSHGLNLSSHLSTPATIEMLQRADAIFTMTQGHRAAILSQAPELAPIVQPLVPDGRDVSDPIGMGRREYELCFEEIRAAIDERLPALLEELRSSRQA